MGLLYGLIKASEEYEFDKYREGLIQLEKLSLVNHIMFKTDIDIFQTKISYLFF